MKNWEENVFEDIRVGAEEARLVTDFLNAHDFAQGTRRGFVLDIRKFGKWFTATNHEPLVISRVTTRDITDFKNHLHRELHQAPATINRTLVMLRRFFGWLVEQGDLSSNPAKPVKELQRVQLSPKGLDAAAVRRLLREVELRGDVRAAAVFNMLLYSGARVGDLVNLELGDLEIGERSGSVVFRHGKGSKMRSCPLPLPARRAMTAYLEGRPPVQTGKVFIGERGSLTARGIRAMCDKYSAIIGVKLHPHIFRHTMAKRFLADNANDIVSLAQLLGHSNVATTSRYSLRSHDQLADASDKMTY